LPPPNLLENYGQIVDNGAERVFHQFELEGNHRRKMEGDMLKTQARDLMVGKVFALIFVLAMIGTAIYAIHAGYPVLSGVLGTAVIGTVVLAFVRVTGSTEAKILK